MIQKIIVVSTRVSQLGWDSQVVSTRISKSAYFFCVLMAIFTQMNILWDLIG